MSANKDIPVQLQIGTNDADKTALINQNFRTLSENINPYRLSDGNNDVLLLGKDSTGDYALKIAKPGYDAYNATDSELLYNSKQNVLKVLKVGYTSFSVPAGYSAGFYGTIIDLSDVLGWTEPSQYFFPQFDAYAELPSNLFYTQYRFKLPYSKFVAGTLRWHVNMSAGTTMGYTGPTIQIGVELTTTGLPEVVGSWAVQYILYQESF